MLHRWCKALIIYFLISLLAVLSVSCGGDGDGGGAGGGTGGGDTGSGGDVTTPIAVEEVVEFNVRPGPIVAVRVGETAVLDGSYTSTTMGDLLTYDWSFVHKPDGSNAELLDATTVNPTFIPDARGTYMVQLVVSARGVSSPRVITTVLATNDGERPTGPFHHMGLS